MNADELEKAIADNPTDVAAHAAYADYLTQQGDPRGEFIRVQLALEDLKRPVHEREELARREQELLEQHSRSWLGSLAPYLLDQQGMADLRPWAELGSDPPTRERKYAFAFRRGSLAELYVPVLTVEFSRTL